MMNLLDGRYRLDALIGRGGFGTVYQARDLAQDADVAIKLLAGVGAGAAKRLEREAKVLARIQHRNCVRFLDYGEHQRAPYLVMELIEGHPLDKEIGQPWAPLRAVEFVLQLLDGLAHAHAVRLVHRDLKPSNLLLTRGPAMNVKIIDFGLVTIAAGEELGSFAEQLTTVGKVVGTPRYMSPEQLLGADIDGRSDLYACGLILYELLAGRPAFDSSDVRHLAWMHAVSPPPPLPASVPDSLATIVERLLAKSRQQRPRTAADLHQQLLTVHEALGGRSSELESIPTTQSPAHEVPHTAATEAASDTLMRPSSDAADSGDPLDASLGADYEPLCQLGRGSFGVVYKARRRRTNQLVAIKTMRMHAGSERDKLVARFLRESQLSAQLHHPNVVSMIDAGQNERGELYTVLSFVPGRTLREVLDEEGALSPGEACHLMAQVLDALVCAHQLGIVHRDIKPTNIMITSTGARRNALVLDFGIGTVVETMRSADYQQLTATADRIGTPGYGAPEQWRAGKVSPATDLYAWGVVLLECLTGERCFPGRSVSEVLLAQLQREFIEVPASLERSFGELLRRVTNRDPAARPSSGAELLRELEAIAGRGVELEGTRSIARDGATRELAVLACRVALDPLAGEHDQALLDALDACTRIVEDHGGQRVATCADRGLFAFASAAGTSAATRAAAAAALELAARIGTSHERLAVHVGLHCGPVPQAGALGLTWRVVDELATRAAAQGVLVSETAVHHVRETMRIHAAGRLAASDASLRAFTLGGPFPLDAASHAAVIGRERELARLDARWQAARRGKGCIVWITGEPGVGKRHLVRAWLARTTPSTCLHVTSSCAPTPTPLGPLRQLLVGVLAGGTLDALLDRQGLELGEHLEPLRALLDADVHDVRRVQQSMRELVLALSLAQPLAWVIEDMQLADAATREFVLDLRGALESAALVIVLVSTAPPLGDDAVELSLARLSELEVDAMLAELAEGMEVPAEIVDEITAACEGLPGLVVSLWRALLDHEVLIPSDDAYELARPYWATELPELLASIQRSASTPSSNERSAA